MANKSKQGKKSKQAEKKNSIQEITEISTDICIFTLKSSSWSLEIVAIR